MVVVVGGRKVFNAKGENRNQKWRQPNLTNFLKEKNFRFKIGRIPSTSLLII